MTEIADKTRVQITPAYGTDCDNAAQDSQGCYDYGKRDLPGRTGTVLCNQTPGEDEPCYEVALDHPPDWSDGTPFGFIASEMEVLADQTPYAAATPELPEAERLALSELLCWVLCAGNDLDHISARAVAAGLVVDADLPSEGIAGPLIADLVETFKEIIQIAQANDVVPIAPPPGQWLVLDSRDGVPLRTWIVRATDSVEAINRIKGVAEPRGTWSTLPIVFSEGVYQVYAPRSSYARTWWRPTQESIDAGEPNCRIAVVDDIPGSNGYLIGWQCLDRPGRDEETWEHPGYGEFTARDLEQLAFDPFMLVNEDGRRPTITFRPGEGRFALCV